MTTSSEQFLATNSNSPPSFSPPVASLATIYFPSPCSLCRLLMFKWQPLLLALVTWAASLVAADSVGVSGSSPWRRERSSHRSGFCMSAGVRRLWTPMMSTLMPNHRLKLNMSIHNCRFFGTLYLIFAHLDRHWTQVTVKNGGKGSLLLWINTYLPPQSDHSNYSREWPPSTSQECHLSTLRWDTRTL